MAYISVPVSPLFSLAATCVFFVVGLCFVASSVIQIAHGNFQQLKELHELGPTQFARQGTRPLLIHMTDVHITSNEQTKRIGGGIGGIRCFRESLEFVSQSRPKYLIISGDLTDTGCSEEWQQAGELIANFSESEAPFLVLAPGNHDLSESYDEMSRVDQMRLYFESIARISPRMISFVELTVADIIQKVYSAAAPPLVAEIGTILKDIYITGSKPATRFPPVSSTRRERRAKAENVDWQSIARDKLIDQWFRTYGGDLFPLRIYDEKQKTMIFVLNSVMRAGTFGESALGFLGTKQLSRLYGHLRTLPQEAENVLVVTHHSPFRRAGEWQLVLSPHQLGRSFTEVMDYCFLSHQAEEARAFIAKLSACADQYQSVRFFLMCGHRHTAGAGYAGRVLVLEGGALCEEGAGAWIVYANSGRVSIDRENLC